MNVFINELSLGLLSNPLILSIIILGFFSFIFYKQIIGKAGEHWVKKELNKLDKNKYHILNDVMIEENNTTHQIDHIVVSKYGIFVIETKQYNNYIKGNIYSKNWICYAGNKRYYINNPVHQNYGHLLALSKTLNISKDKFIPIVSFSGNGKINISNIKNNEVTTINNLIKSIESYNKEIILNENKIVNKINELNIKDKKKRREHVRTIKSNIK